MTHWIKRPLGTSKIFIDAEVIATFNRSLATLVQKPVKQTLLNDWHDSDEDGVYHVEEWRMSDGSIRQFTN